MSEFKPLQEVRQNFKVDWYRCAIESAELKKLTGRSDIKGLRQAAGHLLLMACTAFFTYSFFIREIWLGFALCLFLHGTIYSFAKSIANHELSHGTVFKTKWLNSVFLRIFSILGWYNFHESKMSHTYHHLYTLHPEGDREVVLPIFPSLKVTYLIQLFTFNIFGGVESNGFIPTMKRIFKPAILGKFEGKWRECVFTDQPMARKKASNWARLLLLFHISLVTVSLALKVWILPVLVTFAPFIANWWRYFVAVPMHAGLRNNVPDFRLCARTITLDPISGFLYWRMNWHIEHHMFAAVPCYSLRKLHKVTAHDMPKPRTLVGAWREMRETWKKQKADPGYQHETALPVRIDAGSEQHGIPLASSLGDLAPDGLDAPS